MRFWEEKILKQNTETKTLDTEFLLLFVELHYWNYIRAWKMGVDSREEINIEINIYRFIVDKGIHCLVKEQDVIEYLQVNIRILSLVEKRGRAVSTVESIHGARLVTHAAVNGFR